MSYSFCVLERILKPGELYPVKNSIYINYSNSISNYNFFFLQSSHDGKYITAGSENQCLYIWRSNPESNNLTVRKDRSSHYEAIKGKWLIIVYELSRGGAYVLITKYYVH